jgi:hypothetical protein
MEIKVNYELLGQAISYYKSLGYQYIDVDWSASIEAINITKPAMIKGPLVNVGPNFLVASAEQSLLDNILNNKLNPGRYVTCTPCFRLGEYDDLHVPYFMKVELMDYQDKIKNEEMIYKVIEDSQGFYNQHLEETEIKEYLETIDLEYKGIELGSYGIRYHKDIGYWVFGTGCAEPRLSYCKGLKNADYQNNRGA